MSNGTVAVKTAVYMFTVALLQFSMPQPSLSASYRFTTLLDSITERGLGGIRGLSGGIDSKYA
jgi:hypothetical protein